MARLCLHIVTFAASIVLSNCLISNNKVFFHEGVNHTAEALYRILNVQPTTYHLHFVPFLVKNNFTFHGFSKITFNLLENTTDIKINAVDLILGKVNLTDSVDNTINIINITTDSEYQRVIITADQVLEKGTYNLRIPYTGLVRNSTELDGVYYGTHYLNGNLTYYAATQFEAMAARKASPCFDEPGLRAEVMVHVARYEHEISVSNMPISSHKAPNATYDNRVWDIYKMSPKMPSYLVAFFIGQFDNISSDNHFYSVYARPDAIDQGEYALSLMSKIIDSLTDFLQVNYTLPKLDLVVLPDFNAGAMENWGMTTIRESLALIQDGVTPEFYRDYLLQILAHEFGHQWFGDLITTEWWGNIWLNEGFATYCQHTISALIQPTWRFDEAFSVRVVQVALEADVDSTHAITYTAYSSSDTKFDDISYRKAGAVLKMVEHTVTLDVFRKGLTTYLLKTNASGGVAKPSLLFEALEAHVSNSTMNNFNGTFNFTTFMKSWTLNEGFPLISVQVNNGSVVVKQERFSLSGITYNTSWYVPLTFTTEIEKDFTTLTPKSWIIPGQDSVELPIPANSGWVIFNILQSGVYRVNYDADNWNMLIEHLKANHTQIPPVNRGQLLDDAFHLAAANYLPYSTLFSLVDYLRKETDYIPWLATMKNFENLILRFQGTDLEVQLKTYVTDLFTAYYNTVANVISKDHITLLGTKKALQFACKLGYAPCINYTSELYKMWLSTDVGFPPEKKTATVCTGLREDPSQAGHVYNKYLDSNVHNDKLEFLYAMACISDQYILQSLMLTAFVNETQDVIKAQNIPDFFNAIIDKPQNVEMVINFTLSYFSRMVKALGQKRATSLISNLGDKLVLESQINLIESSVNDESLPKLLRESLNATLPGAKNRQSWIQTYSQVVTTAVSQYQPAPSSSKVLHYSFINIVVAMFAIYKLL